MARSERSNEEYQDKRFSPQGRRIVEVNGRVYYSRDPGFVPFPYRKQPIPPLHTPEAFLGRVMGRWEREKPVIGSIDGDPVVKSKPPKFEKSTYDYEAINKRTAAFLAQLNDPEAKSNFEDIIRAMRQGQKRHLRSSRL